ncbi:sensor histidine kinase [Streptomyces anandii]|uniref:sensor histidine kinase n=1 Tax=Streptomyces anandii TaxID=285454 RepID=UPI0016788F1E|nr:nitrate- and nitrite sensing domain-containing protein [Streptomyces anandii]GGX97237.1 histidine kinase [Streptomyces anandii JCM 4720]
MPGTRDRRTRHRAAPRRSLRSSFVVPFVVPAVCLSALWGYTAAGLVDEQIQSHTDADHVSSVAGPLQEVLTRLQTERGLTAAWQAGRASSVRADLEAARTKTDAAVAGFRRASGLDTAELRRRARTLGGSLDALTQRRSAIDARTLTAGDTFTYFTDAVSQGIDLLTEAVRSDDGEQQRAGTATVALVRGTEMLAREDALMAGALSAHRLSAADRARFGQYLGAQQAARSGLTAEDLPGDAAGRYPQITGGAQWSTVGSLEHAVSEGQGNALPKDAGSWPAAAGGVVGDFQALGGDSLDALAARASDHGDNLMLAALLGTAATLAALAGAALLALRTRRSTLGRFAGLQSEIEQLAAQQVPAILARIERGEHVDPSVLLPHRAHAADDEFGRLSAAVDQLVRIAADSTLRQSQGRQGTEKVVSQLIRRAQSLIHRLISLLDDLERKHEDSDLLKDIFRVDHLATRVRRHAENLMILSGAPPSRRMTPPVSITDVMRSAVAETEQYTRVRVKNTPDDRRVAVSGRAVADVTHLLAELIENGTAFSPPHTQVTVSATRVAKGLAVHVEDQGLGMQPEHLHRANELLAHPPRIDMTALGEDPRLGHFVVARLAERHGIRVVLRESDYGGTLALVVLPAELLEGVSSPVVDQLQSAAVAAGRAVSAPDEPGDRALGSRTGTPAGAGSATGRPAGAVGTPAGVTAPSSGSAGRTPGVAGDGGATPGVGMDAPVVVGRTVPAPPSAPALAPDEVVTHTPLPDSSGFPEYGGAGLLPPASEHPVPTPAEPAAWAPPGQDTDPVRSRPPARPPAPPAGPTASGAGQPDLPRRRQPAAPPPAAPAPAPASGAAAPAPGAGGALSTPEILPQRVRGASLAQQLRREAAQAQADGRPGDEGDDDVFSPEASARAMSAIHQGLKRAGMFQGDEPHGAHGRQDESAGRSADEL